MNVPGVEETAVVIVLATIVFLYALQAGLLEKRRDKQNRVVVKAQVFSLFV
jgi:hypothetical protein